MLCLARTARRSLRRTKPGRTPNKLSEPLSVSVRAVPAFTHARARFFLQFQLSVSLQGGWRGGESCLRWSQVHLEVAASGVEAGVGFLGSDMSAVSWGMGVGSWPRESGWMRGYGVDAAVGSAW